MKHLLILLISILLLSSFITSCVKNGSSPVKVETYTYPDGGKYVGKFKDGKKNGQGTYTYPDGQKYVGRWKDDKRNGQGTFTYPDGREYVGEFKSGERNGQGTETYPDGSKYIGEWRNGDMWNGTSYYKNGNIKEKFVNGMMIKPDPLF